MNVTNVYLMGADPFYRPNAAAMLDLLARHRSQLFFLFTEGKRLDEVHIQHIRRAGNVFPVLNVDGLREATDRRKGEGSFDGLERLLRRMRDLRMPYFVTTMVSRANLDEVTSPAYVRWLEDSGAWLVAFVPYTAVDRHADGALELDRPMRDALFDRSIALNREVRRLAVLDLLGIEQHLTSCPAAVYSMCVYHDGTVTPCPAATFGRIDSNVRGRDLRDVFLNDDLYRSLRALHAAAAPGPVHCQFYTDPAFFARYLAEHRDEVRVLNPGAVRRIEETAASTGEPASPTGAAAAGAAAVGAAAAAAGGTLARGDAR